MSRQSPAIPSAPTSAPPGSPEKVAVLMQRARLKQALWHPQDAAAATRSERHALLLPSRQ
jgi:hypothetical protein